jgi:Icc-related predicted phosphoesterase
LNASPDKVRALFMKLMLEQVSRWMTLAEERLASTGVKMYVTGGNDDPLEIEPVLNSSKYVVNPENKVVDIGGGIEMVSSGFGNITPWKCPRDIEEDVLLSKLESIAAGVKTTETAVFNLHVPPYDSHLDMAPQLDKNLKVDAHAGTGVMMIPVGSTAVRKIIEKYQPMLGLHGHIHESRAVSKIGRTTCINPGSEYGEGFLRGVIIDLNQNGFTYVLTSG